MHVVAKKHHHRSNIPVAVFHLENRPRGTKLQCGKVRGAAMNFLTYRILLRYLKGGWTSALPQTKPYSVQRLRIYRKLSTFPLYGIWEWGYIFIPRVLPWRWHFLSLVTVEVQMLRCFPSKVNLYVGDLFRGGTFCSTCVWAFPWGSWRLCAVVPCALNIQFTSTLCMITIAYKVLLP